MKWPAELIVVRHGESEFNALAAKKAEDPLYQYFCELYDKAWDNTPASLNARGEALEIIDKILAKYSLDVGDAQTPLTGIGVHQAEITGSMLSTMLEVPEVVFISPYLRPNQTFDGMARTWSVLQKITEEDLIQEERIREKEHGLGVLYNDWRVFNLLYPEQKKLHDKIGDYSYSYPNGENTYQVRDRVRSWITTLIREFAGKRVLVVTHHVTILALRANLEKLSPEEFIELDKNEKPINCGVTIYKGDPGQGSNGKLVLECYNRKLYD